MILLDGAMGTLLHQRGVPTPPPLWSAHAVQHAPEQVAAIHRAYAEAGATVHTACTFRTAPDTAGPHAEALSRAAVALARAAVPAEHRVAGSIAPIHDCYRPDLSPPDPEPLHSAFAELLAQTGVDLLLVETFAHPGEAIAATRAAARTGLEVWTALSPGHDGSLLDPEPLAAAAAAVQRAGASVVLVNCLPAVHALRWVEPLRRAVDRWGIYANAGLPEHGLWHGTPQAAERYASLARAWSERGAAVIGGCCGTGPAHLRAVRDALGAP